MVVIGFDSQCHTCLVNGDSVMAKVDKNVLGVVVAIADSLGMTLQEVKEYGLTIREDSNGWSSGDDSLALGFIMWESSGQWTEKLWEMEFPGCWTETICGWGLVGVYPK